MYDQTGLKRGTIVHPVVIERLRAKAKQERARSDDYHEQFKDTSLPRAERQAYENASAIRWAQAETYDTIADILENPWKGLDDERPTE